MKEFPKIETPMNPQERMLQAQILRLDALCVMMSDFVEAYAKVNNLGVEEVKVVEQVPKKTSTPKQEQVKTTRTRKPRKTTPKIEKAKE